MRLAEVIAALRRLYGAPNPPIVRRPFEMILRESASYLVDDERRDRVWLALKKDVGATPKAILACSTARLQRVIKDGGMLPPMRAGKLRKAATIAAERFGGDLDGFVERVRAGKVSIAQARRELKRFPGIADPGADKVLLYARVQRSLAPDSNALRALVRLGFGREGPRYDAMYRSAGEAVADEVAKRTFDWLIGARQLLRRHGQTLCRARAPLCEECPLAPGCPVGSARA